jgi:hypothetical protein
MLSPAKITAQEGDRRAGSGVARQVFTISLCINSRYLLNLAEK